MKALIAAVALCSGCASITNGTTQDIVFDAPVDQVCLANTAEQTLGSVQGQQTITVERDSNPITLHCPTFTKTYTPSISAAGWTSITLIDFGLVDYATGAIWEYGETTQ